MSDTVEAPTASEKSPENELKAKQDALKKAQDNIAALQDDIKGLKSNIEALQQALSGYDALSKSMRERLAVARTTVNQKIEIADAAVKGIEKVISSKIEKFDERLSTKSREVDSALADSNLARKAAEDAESTFKAKQLSYDQVKKRPKDVEGALKEVQGLLDQANQADTKSEYVTLFFLAGEARKILASDRVKILSENEFRSMMTRAQQDVERARQDATQKRTQADQKLAFYNEL